MNYQKDIVFIVPPTHSYTQRLPLGIMSISSYIKSQGYDNTILDFKGISLNSALEEIKKFIIEFKSKIIGISCLVLDIHTVKEISEFIRENSPHSIIVIGGPHPSICPDHFVIKKVCFDYLVIGEGEYTFLELVKHLFSNEKDVESIKGIAYLKEGSLRFNEPRNLITDLDSMPFPAYDKVNMEYYCRPNVWAIRPVYISGIWMFTSRGCPYNCKFCTAHTIFGKRVRFMSPERVAEHIEQVVKTYKIDGLFLGDESFTISKDRVYKIFDILQKKNIRILFGLQTRVNLLDEDLLVFLKRNRCIQIDLGIESGSDRMLTIMNKGTNVEMIKKIGLICHKIHLRTLANMLINIPGETLADIEESLHLVKEMKYNMVLWNVYVPFPGVTFGRELELKDFDIMLSAQSKESINLLETKYKFGDYSMSLAQLTDRLYSQIAHPRYLKFSIAPMYWISFFISISFIFDHKYWFQIIKSKRKVQYFRFFFRQHFST